MDLATYANNMPKSTDPYQGFIRDIFSLQPNDLPHWIAPVALAKYGRDSSGNSGVTDTTGASIDELSLQLDNNNPIIIYATSKFKEPKPFIEEVPSNFHVMLLTGYNKITNTYIITDPWTEKDGSTEKRISKNTLETRYNQLGRKSVVIK